jgi:Skp family chaperone for outer membrane proteins
MFGNIVQQDNEKPPLSPSTTVSLGDNKQEFKIRDLPTRSVTLYPTRAQIVRDVSSIKLQSGANQIIINGLSPTIEEHSIKVEGTGSATITDVLVDRLPNKEMFEDIYPSESSEDEDIDDSDSEDEDPAVIALGYKIKAIYTRVEDKQELINSAAARLAHCESFSKSDSRDPVPSDLGKLILAYKEERQKIFADHQAAKEALDGLYKELANLEKKKAKLLKSWTKTNERKRKDVVREKEKRARQRAVRQKERQRIQRERESFWPKQTYRVIINLEPSTFTPSSSRRTSIDDGDTVVNLATSTFHENNGKTLELGEISLSLSYITSSASWSPRYDLNLNTVKCTGLLEYGAELRNTTSETWQDAKIVLSTSQTNFSGLTETIPVLQPWHVRLLKGPSRGDDYALMSHHEISAKQREWSQSTDNRLKPRAELFGRDKKFGFTHVQNKPLFPQLHGRTMAHAPIPPPPPPAFQSFGNQNSLQSSAGGGLFGQRSAPTGGLFGAQVLRDVDQRPHEMSTRPVVEEARSSAPPASSGPHRPPNNTNDQEEDLIDYSDEDLSNAAPNSLTFEAGAWGESGMSTTYDVPGTKTLAPSNSAIKHKIAKIDFRNVIFSHIVIGKLRQVAFLKARLRNTSKITLLKGPLGLTLDGSFLGQTQFPRCSAGESFSLPLGVDPSINVSYPKPTVRRSQSGIFSKEDSNLFARSVVITNTKHNAACELTVLDQIPVSEDERLRIEMTSPNGLKVGGQPIRTGINAAVHNTASKDMGTAKDGRTSVYGASEGGKWGSAVATAKKGGEIAWNVKLNPGQGVKLILEYECVFPGGENVVGTAAGQRN